MKLFGNKTLFHIDIHGKCNRKNNSDMDLGTMPMTWLWPKESEFQDNLVESLKNGFDQVFKNIKIRGFTPNCESDPYLHGYWGNGLTTMTE